LVPRGKGGGETTTAECECICGFFGGGGGGGFLLLNAAASADNGELAAALMGEEATGAGKFSVLGEEWFSMKLFKRPEILYFWLMALALVFPAAIWSLCRSLKLLAVEAAPRASDNVTEEGSLWKFWAVRIAACFCAKVVPSLGGGFSVIGEVAFIRANLD